MAFRIQRSATKDTVVFVLSGDMTSEHTTGLKQLLASETGASVTLDLKDVTLVNRAGVQFLASVEAAGIRIVNFPDYVRSWITAETNAEAQDTQQQESQEPRS